jgi:hypothetical protein
VLVWEGENRKKTTQKTTKKKARLGDLAFNIYGVKV